MKVSASVALILAPAQALFGDPVIYNLEALSNTTQLVVNGINNSGVLTGTTKFGANPNYHAFRMELTPGGWVIGDLGLLSGGVKSTGNAINASGQITGQSFTNDTGTTGLAYRYSGVPGAGGTMANLGTIAGSYSSGEDINDSGQVVGASSRVGTGRHAFLYTGTPGAGGLMSDLGTLGGTTSQAFGINNSGQVVGYAYLNSSTFHAFVYNGIPGNGGTMLDLGTLNGATTSAAYGINDSGFITGESGGKAFLYTGTPGLDGVMRDLGALGPFNALGLAVNSSGIVVGNSSVVAVDTDIHAFLYKGIPGVNGQMIDLDAWFDSVNPTEGAKWILTSAHGISDSGMIIGRALYNDGPGGLSDGLRYFLLDASSLTGVPEPASFSLLAGASILLLRRQPRRQARAIRPEAAFT
jgi:probable HAF family extracellular repeat protein